MVCRVFFDCFGLLWFEVYGSGYGVFGLGFFKFVFYIFMGFFVWFFWVFGFSF